MSKVRAISAAAMASMIGAGLVLSTDAAASEKPAVEKCYGIVKAHKNDCGSPKHACAAQAKTDGSPQEWMFVMKGNCDRIVGGSLKPGGKKK